MGALRRLYVAGSAAGRADVRLLRRYLARGLVVRQLRMQVFAFHVIRRDAGILRVRVTDRVAGGVAVAGRHRLRLPVDRPTTRTIVLRRVAGAGGSRRCDEDAPGAGRQVSMTLRLLALNIANPSPTRAQRQLAWLRERPEDVLVLSETKNSKGCAQLLVGLQDAGWDRGGLGTRRVTATESRWPAA